jgi:hypothetical protein
VAVKSRVIVKDKGWNRIKHDISKLDNAFSKVGFPSDSTLSTTALKEYSDVSEVASVAMFQEFGTKNIPQRPFMSTSFDENKQKIIRAQENVYNDVVDQKISPNQGLGLLGEFGVDLIKKKIIEVKTPPNAPSTIRKKGSSNPLIDTGQMLQSVTHTEVLK